MSGSATQVTSAISTLLGIAGGLLGASPLKLGGVGFMGMEIPEFMPFGGKQATKRKTLIGGVRQSQSLGQDDDDITWSGRFQGSQAAIRADQVDAMRIAGLPVPLIWGTKNYLVKILEFNARYERFYQILYTIKVEILAYGATAPNIISSVLNTPIASLVGADVTSSLGLANVIGSASISSTLATARSVLGAVGPLVGSNALGQVNSALAGVQGVANVASQAANAGLAGVLMGAPNYGGASIASIAGTIQGAVYNSSLAANASAIANYMRRAVKNVVGAS